MAANTSPIYTGTPDIQWITGVNAASTADLTVGTSYLVFTADATNGGFAREMRIKAVPGTATAATVGRAWVNNGNTTATASNSSLFSEIGIPATSTTGTSGNPDFIMPLNVALPAGYKIYLTLGSSVAGTFHATVIGGKY